MALFIIGCFLGAAFGLVLYTVVGYFSKDSDGATHEFYKSRPFLSAIVLGLLFLVFAYTLEALFLHGNGEGYTSFVADPKTYVSATKELFFAFVISVFVIATVELASRTEQEDFFKKTTTRQEQFLKDATERAQRDVFEAVFKNRIAPEIYEEVEASIYKARFVRTSHSRLLMLKPIPGKTEHLMLLSTQEFRVRNVSGSHNRFFPETFLPRPPTQFVGRDKVDRIDAWKVKNGARGEHVLSISEPEELEKFRIPEGLSPYESAYRFDGILVENGAELEIVLVTSIVKERFDNEIWTSLIPTLQADVEIRSDVPGLGFTAIGLHRGSMQPTAPIPGNAANKWKILKPLLPFQGYVVSWREEDESTTAMVD